MTELKTDDKWRNISERGINVAIPAVVKKRGQDVQFPFQWRDKDTNSICFINNGYWDTKNYILMDVLGYFFLLKQGGDTLPDAIPPIFPGLDRIKARETELQSPSPPANLPISNVDDVIQQMKVSSEYWVKFTDKDFRKFTSLKMNTNDILKLVENTSRVEFKLIFPVRLTDSNNKLKKKPYTMNMYSRLFEFAFIDKHVTISGTVKGREYYVFFNTMLGELFVNNLLSKNYDYIDNTLYHLPYSAQLLYRRLLVNNSYKTAELLLTTIVNALNLKDKNVTNLRGTVEKNALGPLKTHGFIRSYQCVDGLNGIKYYIKKR